MTRKQTKRKTTSTRASIVIFGCILIGGLIIRSLPNGAWWKCAPENKDYDRRITACTVIIDSGKFPAPVIATALALRGQAYLAQTNYQHALLDFDQAIKADPTEARAYFSRGYAYISLHRYGEAIQDFSRAIPSIPESQPVALSGVIAMRAYSYVMTDRPDAAHKDYDEAVRINPKSVPAFAGRSQIYFNDGDFTKAIADIDQAVRLEPTNSIEPFTRGIYKFYGLSPAAAIDDLRTAINQTSNDNKILMTIWLHIARTRARQDDTQEFQHQAAQVMTDKWPAPLLNLFLVKDAIEQVDAATKIGTPNEQHDQACEDNFYSAEWYLQTDHKEDASKRFNSALTSCRPDNVEYSAARAELRMISH